MQTINKFLKEILFKIRFYVRAYRRLEIMNYAASLSYYTLISIFPMMLILAALSGQFVSNGFMVMTLKKFIVETMPYQSELVMQNLSALFVKKKTLSLFGVVMLFVSAQILYVNFARIVNRLLHNTKVRHFLITRLLFFIWILGFVSVLFAPVVVEMITEWIAKFGGRSFGLTEFVSHGGFLIMGFLIFFLVLRLLSTRKIQNKRLILASASFALTLQLGKWLFKWFTFRNFERYNLIYGSLSSMVLITLWIFYFYNMFLFFIYWVGRDRDPHYQARKAK